MIEKRLSPYNTGLTNKQQNEQTRLILVNFVTANLVEYMKTGLSKFIWNPVNVKNAQFPGRITRTKIQYVM